MNIKQTIRKALLGALLLIPVVSPVFIPADSVYAEKTCGGAKTSIIECEQKGGEGEDDIKKTGVWGLLIFVINFMAAGVGVLAVGGLIYGGIVYSTSAGNPEKTKKGRGIIRDVVIGIIAFGAMFSFLNFIVPGGLFN